MVRIVATFTTLPSRYDTLVHSIKSIKAQTVPVDVIYLTIPKRSKRLKIDYPQVPNEISSICYVVYIDDDFGPITKLYGALMYEEDPETIIISCDDDVIYNHNMVNKLLQHHKEHPNAAICSTGSLIGRGILFYSVLYPIINKKFLLAGPCSSNHGRNVDIAYGVTGVLYLRKFFPPRSELYSLFTLALENNNVFLNDDVLISGYLSSKNIKRKVFSDLPDVMYQGPKDQHALSYNFLNQLFSIDRSVNWLKNKGFFKNTEDLMFHEAIIVRVMFIIFALILLLMLVYMFWLLN
ncbi:MAG: hypothetical protein QXV60_00280 [Nitrososphaerota archaeon]